MRTGVVGAGLMGTGIALQLARAGHPVHVVDAEPDRLVEVEQTSRRVLGDLAAAGLHEPAEDDAVLGRMTTGVDAGALAGCAWVVEAVPERVELKHRVLAQLEGVLDRDAVIASNTSSIMPSVLAGPLRRPHRFLVAHFWNPPHAVPLVEVVPAPQTDEAAQRETVRLLASTGARPVLLQHELPGFIGNRLQFALLREAVAILRSGAATAEQIDDVVTSSLGRRYATVGPLAGADLGGLEVFREVMAQLLPHLAPVLARDEDVQEVLDEQVRAGRTGWRSRAGFHEWTPERLEEVRGRRDRDLLDRLRRDAGQAP